MSTQIESRERSSVPRLSVFNHKGGVGKTTLTVNLALAIAALGKKVLLVDSDPQCNLTSYLVEEAVVDDLLDKSDFPQGATIWSALKPVAEGLGDPRLVEPIEVGKGISLIPGDIQLAEFESELASFWGECFQRKSKGFRGTAALSSMVDAIARKTGVDLVIYDSGPNIGPLNRVILLDCDFFIVPAACDLFSLRAIRTLGRALSEWIKDWRTIQELAPDNTYSLPGKPKLIGFVPQRFRVYASRPSAQFSALLPKIERAVKEDLLDVLGKIDAGLVEAAVNPLILAEIKDLGGMATSAQQKGVAVWEIESATPEQKSDAKKTFIDFANVVLERLKSKP